MTPVRAKLIAARIRLTVKARRNAGVVADIRLGLTHGNGKIGAVAGFIVLEDGRAYAAANWAADTALRAIGREIEDPTLRAWLLAQQSACVGMGLTSVDLREVAPRFRPVLRAAIRAALAEMLRRWDAGEPPEAFNPHMRDVLPPTGDHAGPGWNEP